MALNLDSLVPIYRDRITELINEMGKTITLHFESTVTNADTEEAFDKIREDDILKPKWKMSDKPVITENTEDIIALIQYNPKEFKSFNTSVMNSQSILRVKTFIYHAPKLIRCKFIVPKDSKDVIYGKYKLLKGPIPNGLKENFFCTAYFEQI